ncbi:MAG: hypothetical protein GX158_10255 [Bacteroidales bacterium]|nr:hypothetical protein [Bacteroidales bacterium]
MYLILIVLTTATVLSGFFLYRSRSSCIKYLSSKFPLLRQTGINLLLLFLFSAASSGQAVGDFRTRTTGNWNSRSTWERLNSLPSGWAQPTSSQGYPGRYSGTGTVTIRNGHNVTLNVSPSNDIGSLEIEAGNTTNNLTFNGGYTLKVTGDVNINSTSNNVAKYIEINTGTLTCTNLSLNSINGNNNTDAYVSLTSGTLNIAGDISMNAVARRTYIYFNGNGTVNVGGTISGGNITSSSGGGSAAPTNGTVNYNNNGDQDIGTYTYWTLVISGSGTKTLQAATSLRNLEITESSVLDTRQYQITGNSSGTMTMTGGTELILGNNTSSTNILFPASFTTANINLHNNSTVIYTANTNQTVSGVPVYGNLTILPGNTAGRTRTLSANTTINGNLIIGDGTNSTSFLPRNRNITINGATIINNNGIFIDDNNSGTDIFTGQVTIAPSGQFLISSNSPTEFRGGITNNGVFTSSGSGQTSFSTNSQIINGTNTIEFNGGNINIVNNITVTNQGTVSISGSAALNGAGNNSRWLNDTNSTLSYSSTNTQQPMNTGLLTATAEGNTVSYERSGTQTVKNTTYYNLTLSGSGSKTTTGVAVNGTLSLEETATVSAAISYGPQAALQYNTSNTRTVTNNEWPATFSGTGGVRISGTLQISLNRAKVLEQNVPLIINSGASFRTANYDLTFGGSFINNGGTFNAGSSDI